MDRGIKGPLLGEAKGALIHVNGGEDLTPGEAMRAAESVTESMGEEALGIWGSRVDPALNTDKSKPGRHRRHVALRRLRLRSGAQPLV